ncbi:MAG: nitroreductase family protein [Deltaproteobacteria bacterium]|nr:nitroreductase family protein [Deltaproteobacteria bacterium]
MSRINSISGCFDDDYCDKQRYAVKTKSRKLNALLERGKKNRIISKKLYCDFLAYRWSPRVFSEKPVTHDELDSLFEAARWASSSYNEQEWRYIYAVKNSKEFSVFLNFLTKSNRQWAKNAYVIVVLVGKKYFSHDGSHNKSFQLDCGISLGYLMAESALRGIAVHAMAGFDKGKISEYLKLSDEYEPLCCLAIGHYSSSLKAEEITQRKPLDEIRFNGLNEWTKAQAGNRRDSRAQA